MNDRCAKMVTAGGLLCGRPAVGWFLWSGGGLVAPRCTEHAAGLSRVSRPARGA